MGPQGPPSTQFSVQREADQLTIARFGPPGVIVNAGFQIVQFRGVTAPYLQPAPGKPTADLLKMARQELMLPLRTALKKSQKQNHTVRTENIPLEQHGLGRRVNLEIAPLRHGAERATWFFLRKCLGRKSKVRGKNLEDTKPPRLPSKIRLKTRALHPCAAVLPSWSGS